MEDSLTVLGHSAKAGPTNNQEENLQAIIQQNQDHDLKLDRIPIKMHFKGKINIQFNKNDKTLHDKILLGILKEEMQANELIYDDLSGARKYEKTSNALKDYLKNDLCRFIENSEKSNSKLNLEDYQGIKELIVKIQQYGLGALCFSWLIQRVCSKEMFQLRKHESIKFFKLFLKKIPSFLRNFGDETLDINRLPNDMRHFKANIQEDGLSPI